MLKAMINNFQNFRSEYGGTNTNPEDQLVPNVPPLFYQNEPKETKPKQKVSVTSVAGAGTMSRGGKGVLKSRNTPTATGTLGKKGKRIAMPGTPMPKKPTEKVNDSPDYEFSTLPPPPWPQLIWSFAAINPILVVRILCVVRRLNDQDDVIYRKGADHVNNKGAP